MCQNGFTGRFPGPDSGAFFQIVDEPLVGVEPDHVDGVGDEVGQGVDVVVQQFTVPVTVTLEFDPSKIPAGRTTASIVIFTAPCRS